MNRVFQIVWNPVCDDLAICRSDSKLLERAAERATFLVVKLVRAFGGCLGTKRR